MPGGAGWVAGRYLEGPSPHIREYLWLWPSWCGDPGEGPLLPAEPRRLSEKLFSDYSDVEGEGD